MRNTSVALVMMILGMANESWANLLLLPRSIPEETLSESVPTAFSPIHWDTRDFSVHWASEEIPGVQIKLVDRTFEWVRVADVLTIPRARLSVIVDGMEAGRASNAGFNQAFVVENGVGKLELPVALISGEKNLISLSFKRGGQNYQAKLKIQFAPRAEPTTGQNGFVFIDPSCSPYKVTADSAGVLGKDWAYVGCRMVQVEGETYRTSSLEVFTFWDGVGDTIQVGGVETPTDHVAVWPLRLRSEPGEVSLRGNAHDLVLHYKIPKTLHNTSLALGLGPYHFTFNGDNSNTNTLIMLPTVYASYFFTEAIRIVSFGALAMESHFFTDVGLYLYMDYNRLLDRRININLLLGFHGMGYSVFGSYTFLPTFPQGFEVVYTDAFGKGKNIKLGVFLYPLIAGVSYYNLWLRWGGAVFAEMNYISWRAQPAQTEFSSTALGLSVGFPLFKFW